VSSCVGPCLRHAIDWWAFVAGREDDWSALANQVARDCGHAKYPALRGLGARWTRVLWRAWTDHAPYDPARHHLKPLVRVLHR
jgi:hypothetical protein